MAKTYVIADIHGRLDLLDAALAKIADHASLPATLVTLGDYVDRGPQSKQVIDRLMAGLGHEGWTLVCLKGNHEQIMHDSCRILPSQEWWLQNGGGNTLISYGHPNRGPVDLGYVLDTHLDWINSLPLMHIDRHRIYVHAGVVKDVRLDKQESSLEFHGHTAITWMLYKDTDEGGYGSYHVVHGHHQFKDGPLLKKGRTNLDTGAYHYGRMYVGVFDDDLPGGPIELLNILGPEISEVPSKAEQVAEAAARK